MTVRTEAQARMLSRLHPTHRHLVAYLSDEQIRIAERFMVDPSRVPLPPAALDVLTSILIDRWGTEEYEAETGVPARSTRALVAQALDTYNALASWALVRSAPRKADCVREEAARCGSGGIVDDLVSKIEWLTADGDAGAIGQIMSDLGVSRIVARVALVLRRAGGVVVSRDNMLSRVYHDIPEADIPQARCLDVHVMALRRALPASERVESVRGVGYRLVRTG